MMALVALSALILWLGVRRPYPNDVESYPGSLVMWSDGCSTFHRGEVTFRGNHWFRIVAWPDGRTSYYFVLR